MNQTAPSPARDEPEAEIHALAQAVATAEADPRRNSHEAARTWLLRLSHGDFDAPPPHPT